VCGKDRVALFKCLYTQQL